MHATIRPPSPLQVNAFVVPGGKVVVYTGVGACLLGAPAGGQGRADPSLCWGAARGAGQGNSSPLQCRVRSRARLAQPPSLPPAPAYPLPLPPLPSPPGLLRLARTEDELAAVLAHESAHVVARHAAERITQMGAVEVARALVYW